MLKEGKAYVLPLLLGFLILGCFHLCLANYFLQADMSFPTVPPLQRHLSRLQPVEQPPPLAATDANPFFTTLTEEQEDRALPEQRQLALRLAGIITKGEQHYALIEYGGTHQLYALGDQLGAYRLHAISRQQVILQGAGGEICLAMEKRP